MKDDFIVIMYLTFILNIIIFLFSIIKIIIRRKKEIVYSFSDWIYKYSFIISILINITFFIAEIINNTLIDTENKNFYFFFILFMFLWTLSSFNFWIYSHYYFYIDNEMIIIHRITFGKVVIKMNEIDKDNTYYYCKYNKASNDEYFFITTKHGQKYKVNLDSILYDGKLWILQEIIKKQKIKSIKIQKNGI